MIETRSRRKKIDRILEIIPLHRFYKITEDRDSEWRFFEFETEVAMMLFVTVSREKRTGLRKVRLLDASKKSETFDFVTQLL